MTSNTLQESDLRQVDSHWVVSFSAMACPCEVLLRCHDASEAEQLASLAREETFRLERKFSRYRDDNIIHEINQSRGLPVRVDEETQNLLHYAGECYRLSQGRFDITSGVLRRAWDFKGQEFQPNQQLIDSLLESIGWDKVQIEKESISLQPGMEIDFGGFGKEYAVDRVAQLLYEKSGVDLMVNFGGDIRAMAAPGTTEPWCVGLADPDIPGKSIGQLELVNGAVTTSGDAYRYCFVNGQRLGHILNPLTGWPVENTPRSITVVSDFCLEAGLFTTIAMLQGEDAKKFLAAQEVKYYCVW